MCLKWNDCLGCVAAVIICILGVTTAKATVTINFAVRGALDSTGVTPVADGTLWAIIMDDGGGDNTLTGISVAGVGGSLKEDGTPTTFTANQSLSIGQSIGSGIVFAMGKFEGYLAPGDGGDTVALADLTLGVNGLVTGRSYGIYWFPGATYTGAGSYSITSYSPTQYIGSQVGGIVSKINSSSGTFGNMIVPTDTSTIAQGARVADWTTADFTAVQLVPEPTSSLLSMFGGLALLFRRRRSA